MCALPSPLNFNIISGKYDLHGNWRNGSAIRAFTAFAEDLVQLSVIIIVEFIITYNSNGGVAVCALLAFGVTSMPSFLVFTSQIQTRIQANGNRQSLR